MESEAGEHDGCFESTGFAGFLGRRFHLTRLEASLVLWGSASACSSSWTRQGLDHTPCAERWILLPGARPSAAAVATESCDWECCRQVHLGLFLRAGLAPQPYSNPAIGEKLSGPYSLIAGSQTGGLPGTTSFGHQEILGVQQEGAAGSGYKINSSSPQSHKEKLSVRAWQRGNKRFIFWTKQDLPTWDLPAFIAQCTSK